MPRPQFTIRALLVLLLAVACFFGGLAVGRDRERQLQRDLTAAKESNAFLSQQRRALTQLLDAAERRIAELTPKDQRSPRQAEVMAQAAYRELGITVTVETSGRETLTLPDGTHWERAVEPGSP